MYPGYARGRGAGEGRGEPAPTRWAGRPEAGRPAGTSGSCWSAAPQLFRSDGCVWLGFQVTPGYGGATSPARKDAECRVEI